MEPSHVHRLFLLSIEDVQNYVVRKDANDTMIKVDNAEFWWEQPKEKTSPSNENEAEEKEYGNHSSVIG